jgi:hypothetical protein
LIEKIKMTSSKEMMNKAYIDHKLASIFEPMVNQILQEQPGDTVSAARLPFASSSLEQCVSLMRIDRLHDKVFEGALRKQAIQ